MPPRPPWRVPRPRCCTSVRARARTQTCVYARARPLAYPHPPPCRTSARARPPPSRCFPHGASPTLARPHTPRCRMPTPSCRRAHPRSPCHPAAAHERARPPIALPLSRRLVCLQVGTPSPPRTPSPTPHARPLCAVWLTLACAPSHPPSPTPLLHERAYRLVPVAASHPPSLTPLSRARCPLAPRPPSHTSVHNLPQHLPPRCRTSA
ncbi:hypothetical protein HD554DRAFT_2117587 [Boletus coccyginus]|nr:hypothetical protein HD554DRAFT_2117587 [Boletus coccyginus]